MKAFIAILLMLLTCPIPSGAFERFDIVTTEQLREMLTARESQASADFLLVNTLDEIIYRNESIPGSVSLPWSNISNYKSILGDNKDKEIIFY